MKRNEIEEVTISILTRVHERYKETEMDDAEYISIIKASIQGAVDSGNENELSEIQIDKLTTSLFSYVKELYIQGCLVDSDDDSDKDDFIAENGEWFDYIYEHGKYP